MECAHHDRAKVERLPEVIVWAVLSYSKRWSTARSNEQRPGRPRSGILQQGGGEGSVGGWNEVPDRCWDEGRMPRVTLRSGKVKLYAIRAFNGCDMPSALLETSIAWFRCSPTCFTVPDRYRPVAFNPPHFDAYGPTTRLPEPRGWNGSIDHRMGPSLRRRKVQ
jgi:hypothetical protein